MSKEKIDEIKESLDKIIEHVNNQQEKIYYISDEQRRVSNRVSRIDSVVPEIIKEQNISSASLYILCILFYSLCLLVAIHQETILFQLILSCMIGIYLYKITNCVHIIFFKDKNWWRIKKKNIKKGNKAVRFEDKIMTIDVLNYSNQDPSLVLIKELCDVPRKLIVSDEIFNEMFKGSHNPFTTTYIVSGISAINNFYVKSFIVKKNNF